MARALLNHGQIQSAKKILRDIFDRREIAFGERHTVSQEFIDELLEDYCTDFEGEPSDRYRNNLDCAFVDDLIEYCINRKAYDELDAFVQETVFPREDTNSVSDDRVFIKWGHFRNDPIPKVQPRLASHQTPRWGCYWEDSRMYFCTWDEVTLIPEYPEDPFPRAPIRLFVTDDTISIDLSAECLADFRSIPDVDVASGPIAFIHKSEIWQLLESKRLSKDWKVLLALSSQGLCCTELIRKEVNHVFWLFWDEVILKDQTPTSSTSRLDDQVSTVDRNPRLPYTRTYRFDNLDRTKPEWLVVDTLGDVVSTAHGSLDPHEPIPGDANGNYIEINSYSFFSMLRMVLNKPAVPGSLRYEIRQPGEKHIDINVPFVPYEHFRSSRAYREGLSYLEYLEILRDRANGEIDPIKTKVSWCKGELAGRLQLPIFSLTESTSVVSGFHINYRRPYFV